jgi:molybdopterin synthase sulfur carrier subunit
MALSGAVVEWLGSGLQIRVHGFESHPCLCLNRNTQEKKMNSIKIPTPLRVYTANQAQVSVNGTTVGEALNDLTTQYPELRQHLFKENELRNFVNVYIGEEDIRFLGGLETELAASDSLRIIPSIAGG